MACSDQSQLLDFWTNFAWFDGVNCFYADQLGQGVIAFLFFGITAAMLYDSAGPGPAAVIAVVTGGVIFAVLPAAGAEVALLVILLAVGTALYLMWKRASLQ